MPYVLLTFNKVNSFRIPFTSSSFVFGLISLLRNSFSSCQKFSMGLRSGDSGGVCHELIPWSSRNFCQISMYAWDHCLETPLQWKARVFVKNLYKQRCIHPPFKIQTAVGHRTLIPAQTWTLTGYFGLGLFLGGSPFLRQQKWWCDSAWIEHSSEKIMLLNLSPRRFCAKRSRFSLFWAWMSWQYELPWKSIQGRPYNVRQFSVRSKEPLSFSSLWSCTAVVSSSVLICSSKNSLISPLISDILPLPSRRWIVPLVS